MDDSLKTPRSYWCFVSYRHADNKEPGRQWATWLHQAIETYEVPDDLVGQTNERGDVIPERIFPVFRDEEELPVDADLASPIYRALDASKSLVVICSPRVMQSSYVAQEIRYFKQLGRADRVMAVMIEGEPNVSRDEGKRAAGFRVEQECFPEALLQRAGPDGQSSTEPVVGDFRIGTEQGWTSPEAYRQVLKDEGRLDPKLIRRTVEAYRGRIELMKLKLIAGILGVGLGILTKRDKAYQLARAKKKARIRNIAVAVLSGLTILATAAGILAWQQKQVAVASLVRTEFLNGVDQTRSGKNNEALAYYAATLRLDPNNRPAAAAIFLLLTQQGFILRQMPPVDLGRKPAWGAKFSPDGQTLAVAAGNYRQNTGGVGGAAFLLDAKSGQILQRFDHPDAVLDVAFSPDGADLATACADGVARVWDVHSGKQLGEKPPESDAGDILNISFGPDGREIRMVSRYSVWAWDFPGNETHVLSPREDDQQLSVCEFSPDGELCVIGNGTLYPHEGFAQVRSARTGAAMSAPLQLGGMVEAAAFSPDGHLFATGTSTDNPHGGEVCIWETATQRLVAGPLLHGDRIKSIVFSADGTRLLTASCDHTAVLWDVRSGARMATMQHAGVVQSARFSPDGQWIATDSEDDAVRFWNAETGEAVSESLTVGDVPKNEVFNADGRSLAVCVADGTVEFVAIPNAQAHGLKLPHASEACAAAFSSDGNEVAAGYADSSIGVWSTRTGAIIKSLGPNGGRVDAVGFSPDGRELASASGVVKDGRGEADIWDLASGKRTTPALVHDMPGDQEHAQESVMRDELKLRTVSFSPDGRLLVTASQDRTARVWEVATGRCLYVLPHDQTVYWAGFSPDGKWIISADGSSESWWKKGNIRIWNSQTGVLVQDCVQAGGYIYQVAISGDGERLAAASWGGNAQVRDLPGGTPVGPIFSMPGTFLAIGLNYDGTRTAVADTNGFAYLWDSSTGKMVTNPMEHEAEVHTDSFSPDGRFLLTASADGTARIWDTTLGQPLGEPFHHSSPVDHAIFNADGTRVAVICQDGSTYLWDLPPVEPAPTWLPDLAEAVAARRLNSSQLFEPVPVGKFIDLKNALMAAPTKSGWDTFGKWFFTDSSARAPSPWSAIPSGGQATVTVQH